MKNLILILAALVALAVLAYQPSGRADYVSPDFSGSKTCSGRDTGQATQLYFFGFTKSDGFCMTKPFNANTYGEAKECAVKICPDCGIEDVMGKYTFGSAMPDVNDIRGFCPARTQ
jgi:hypothetical protein